ncbi:MAG: ATPase [Candidatus Sericytochromatia bacterium]|nr:ATPase [Candidatus Sericytochromatia bacterium]
MNRKGESIKEAKHDPYMLKEKYPDPSVCETCNVVFTKGIYKWEKIIPENANKIKCPVCKRIWDDFEGGSLVLEGEFLDKHKEEIMNLINSTAKLEGQTHPLERIIEIKNIDNKLEVRTTYEHLARRLGDAIHRAYKGDLNYTYSDDKYIRASWRRDN